ncbi:MAG: hypothetical protein LAT66_12800 [Alkalimonas sp.]|nr:hypothetical protein [Alkalimonas sp.]
MKFAELSVTEEIKGVEANESGIDFSISFVETDVGKNYYRQCPMNIVVISKHAKIPRKIPDILFKISEGYKPLEGGKANNHDELVRKEGPDYGIDCYPDSLKNFLTPIGKAHSDLLHRINSILSWRCFDTRDLSYQCKNWGLLFSFDFESWHRLPILGSISVEYVEQPPNINKFLSSPEEITKIIGEPQFITLPIELLCEAKKVINSSPRSSLVIAVSALEVKLKDFISKKTDKAEWLINNLQSPPIDKLLSDYVPNLVYDKQEYFKSIDKYISVIKNVISERNKITHLGCNTTAARVESYISSIEKVMYILDYYCNCEWARSSDN